MAAMTETDFILRLMEVVVMNCVWLVETVRVYYEAKRFVEVCSEMDAKVFWVDAKELRLLSLMECVVTMTPSHQRVMITSQHSAPKITLNNVSACHLNPNTFDWRWG